MYIYYEEGKESKEATILYQMKDYTFDFKDERFSLDIIDTDPTFQLFKIYTCPEGLCGYFKMPKNDNFILKVMYDNVRLAQDKKELFYDIFYWSLLVLVLIIILSFGFAIYAIRPMKKGFNLLEEFLKDLVHDLNTPATSISLNAELLRARGVDFEEIERIELSAKNIASLYKNLEVMKNESVFKGELVRVDELIKERVKVLQKLYPKIGFIMNLKTLELKSSEHAISRILDNILTNACKYNKKNGKVSILIEENFVIIKDTGIGINHPERVFDRYYKENARGLGIGMHIVKHLCDILDVKVELTSKIEQGTSVKLIFN
jgi:two-component system OmpR family sensor kinase